MTTSMQSNYGAPTRRALTRADYDRYSPMVRRIAMRMARRVPRHIDAGDLVSSGWVGLVEAFSRIDEGMSHEEFEAYASHRVKGAMLDYLRALDPAARQMRNASRRVARAIAKFTAENGRAPDESEIAATMGLTMDEYRDLLQAVSTAGMSRLELIDVDQLDGKAEGPEEETEKRQLADSVAQGIESLPERLQQLLALYYQEGCTLREIGSIFGVSESRVCQLHSEAMHRLRAAIGKE